MAGPPDLVQAGEIWLGLLSTDTGKGYYQADELTYAQLAQFIRKLTIGDATKDSDDYISSWILGDFSGGGQIKKLNVGADANRFWTGFADTTSPNRVTLPRLFTAARPNSNCSESYPLEVGNDGIAYVAFKESGTWKVWGFKESTLDFSYNSGTGVALGAAPANKAVRFDGVIYVPLGSSGYARVTGSAGTPTCTAVSGANDPTTASPTSAPHAAAFAIFNQRLYCLTVQGGICYHTLAQKAAGSNEWHWPYGESTTDFPHIETSATPKHLTVFPDRSGVESLYATTDRGLLIYDDNNPIWLETHVEFPPHPDAGKATKVWPPGGDLHNAVGLADVKYTTAFVVDPYYGLARDHGVPQDLRGAVLDFASTVDRLFACVGGVTETSTSFAYSAKTGSAGSGNGAFNTPHGLAVVSDGVWVADTNNERIQKFDTTPAYSTKSGSSGSGDGQFAADGGAYDLAVDGSGNLWVVDKDNHRIQKFNASGVYQSQIDGHGTTTSYGYDAKFGSDGSGNGALNHPYGIAVNSSGDIYVCDFSNNRLQKFNSAGTYQSQITSLSFCRGVCIDSSDNVYVVYGSTGTVRKYNSSHTLQWTQTFGSELLFIATDDTNLYVTDRSGATGNRVWKRLCSTGAAVTNWGTSGSGNGQFNQCTGIAYNPISTYVYVADGVNHRVQYFTTAGSYVGQFGSSGSSSGQFSAPWAVTVAAASGNVLVSDFDLDRVQVFDSAGAYLRQFGASGTGDGQFSECYGIVANSAGTVWATDYNSSGTDRIQKFTLTTTSGAGDGNGELSSPQGLAIKQSSGRIYVADTGNNRIEYFTSAGAYEGQFNGAGSGAAFSAPTQVKVNQSTGEVYVVDTGNKEIKVFSATGSFLRKWGGAGSGNGTFSNPVSLAINAETGEVAVGDDSRDDIQVFTSSGTYVRTIGAAGSGNGQFANPYGLGYASDGTVLWVSDSGNARIQKLTAQTTTSTLTSYPSVHEWTGTGWHGCYKHPSNSATPTVMQVMNATGSYRLMLGMDDGSVYHTKLRRTFHNPREGFIAGVDEFHSTGYLETGEFDAGMSGFYKLASHVLVYMESATSTETVTVEMAVDGGGWESLGTVSMPGRTALPINVQDDFSRGRRFNKIALRATWARGSNKLLTPVLDNLALHFTKIPQNTTSFQLSVPLSPYKDRSPAEQYNDLTNLVTAGEFLPFVHGRDSYDSGGVLVPGRFRVLIAAVSGLRDSGATLYGRADLSIIAIPDGR